MRRVGCHRCTTAVPHLGQQCGHEQASHVDRYARRGHRALFDLNIEATFYVAREVARSLQATGRQLELPLIAAIIFFHNEAP